MAFFLNSNLRIPHLRFLPTQFLDIKNRSSYIKSKASLKQGGESHPSRSKEIETLQNLSERFVVERLKTIDAQVRAHEQAHMAALNGYARGAPQYTHIMGPDGRLYATGGNIDVDLRPIPGNPQATIRKARILRRAAYGPMQPSGPDMRIAAAAYRLEMEARR